VNTIKSKIKSLGLTVLIWSILNLLFDLVGVLLNELDSEITSYLFFFEMQCVLFQVLVFGLAVILIFAITKKEKLSIFLYCLFQLVIFHFIFFNNLTNDTGSLRFWAGTDSWDYKYLEAHKPSLSYQLERYDPMYGNFSEGMFIPDSLSLFYFRWIVLTLVGLFAITWLTYRIQNWWIGKAFKRA
jgi:hypothetical protein